MGNVIDGIKLIRHTGGGVNEPDDTIYPFLLEVVLQPPALMAVGFAMLYGNEEIVVRGMTRKALEEFVDMNHFQNIGRLISCTIYDAQNQPVVQYGRC